MLSTWRSEARLADRSMLQQHLEQWLRAEKQAANLGREKAENSWDNVTYLRDCQRDRVSAAHGCDSVNAPGSMSRIKSLLRTIPPLDGIARARDVRSRLRQQS